MTTRLAALALLSGFSAAASPELSPAGEKDRCSNPTIASTIEQLWPRVRKAALSSRDEWDRFRQLELQRDDRCTCAAARALQSIDGQSRADVYAANRLAAWLAGPDNQHATSPAAEEEP